MLRAPIAKFIETLCISGIDVIVEKIDVIRLNRNFNSLKNLTFENVNFRHVKLAGFPKKLNSLNFIACCPYIATKTTQSVFGVDAKYVEYEELRFEKISKNVFDKGFKIERKSKPAKKSKDEINLLVYSTFFNVLDQLPNLKILSFDGSEIPMI
ncbi:unnamed protein product [Caenorhabditis bovis]|uniref:Uncharacterized protein n=1 Tax=Caenorhabditis bovis TaxID=2654633 RepID=A0A8S1F441_9PELO|nr:unnamed protein product [Caenorhabditis bovis]